MKDQMTKRSLRCAIYTRVSTDQGLEQDFNSLDAQREAAEAYIKSQAHEGWRLIRDHYDGILDAPAHMEDCAIPQRDAMDGRGPKRKARQAA